jgi:hypothetical protein
MHLSSAKSLDRAWSAARRRSSGGADVEATTAEPWPAGRDDRVRETEVVDREPRKG